MLRRGQLRKTCLAIVLALAVVCWCQPAAADLYDLTVKAWIDGYSQLIIQGSTVQWHHIDYTVPGKEAGHDDPTDLATVDMGTVHWYPTWPKPYEQVEQDSSLFAGLNLPLAALDQIVGFTKVDVRYNAFISQQPSAANDYKLIVDFNDNPPGGAYYYTVRLDYIPGPAIPIPGTLALLGPALVGLAVFGRSRLGLKK